MPHDYLLQQFKIAIDRLVPLTPGEVVEEAKKIYEELAKNPAVTESLIHQALLEIGRKEFPYRKAYAELCAQDEEKRLQEATVRKLAPALQAKIQPILTAGVSVLDYVNSQMFEEALTGAERHEVEEALMSAHEEINRQCDERAAARQATYAELVERWRDYAERLQKKIEVIRQLATRAHDADLAAEIFDVTNRFEEGWSMLERDPEEQEVQQAYEDFATRVEEGEAGEEYTA